MTISLLFYELPDIPYEDAGLNDEGPSWCFTFVKVHVFESKVNMTDGTFLCIGAAVRFHVVDQRLFSL